MTSDNDQGQPELQHSKSVPDTVLPGRQALAEALILSAEILRNLEVTNMPLTNVALKASRLARLLNEFDNQKIMEYEAGGYPITGPTFSQEVWRLAVAAGRRYQTTDPSTKELKEVAYGSSIGELEQQLRIAEASLAAARDPDVAISSSNPSQYVWSPTGNLMERNTIRQLIAQTSQRLASRRAWIYQYALGKHYELKFSGIADDVFTRIRGRADASIGKLIPDATKRFTAAYENLLSENPENWSNAVHSCRRILLDLADAIFPPTDKERTVEAGGKSITVKLGKDQYINRIMAFVQDASESESFAKIVGSHLGFLGDRLDSISNASQKGTHTTIVSKEEADRYVVYTYLIVGDILTLHGSTEGSSQGRK